MASHQYLVFMLFAGSLLAQSPNAPVLITPPNIQYPPIAKAAHVQGVVIVIFSIDSAGRTISVSVESGPVMLRTIVEQQISQWRFRTPLPMGAQDEFEATYSFLLDPDNEDFKDPVDSPPYSGCCSVASQVTGKVLSRDGSQSIDVHPAPPVPPQDRCPDDPEKQPPTNIRADDFIELYRTTCDFECHDYRVRVHRDGRVDWHGAGKAAVQGDSYARINPDISANLLATLQTPVVWSACSVELPEPNLKSDDEDFNRGDYLILSIDGHIKNLEADKSFGTGGIGEKFAWAIDEAADTHRWRHGDSASEPFKNMFEDLKFPKPGVTALIRATYRFSPSTGQLTLEPLKHFIATGADIEATDESGWTPLMYAIGLNSGATDESQPEILLLHAHASIHRASLHGDTALMIAAYHGIFDTGLAAAGADVNARNADGVTALMFLAQHIEPDELEKGLAAGADPGAKDNLGRTALDYLREASCGHPIIPLPSQQFVETVAIVTYGPAPPCPAKDENALKSLRILEIAMRNQKPPATTNPVPNP